ncbi:hypothetical protein [Capnocytophaga gingivalis]|uniref:hypothetical protein n=1 Tax=Capnocytophaga gingivalis TaxID=1017 RepID=UPI00403DE58F
MAKDNENRELTLEERLALLEDRSSELSTREAAVDRKESELNDIGTELEAREKALDQREQALDEREKALALREATQEGAGAPEVSEEKREGHAFSFRGKKYQFADDAPLQILFGGERYTQEELAADEEALVQLIGGGSALIVKSEE